MSKDVQVRPKRGLGFTNQTYFKMSNEHDMSQCSIPAAQPPPRPFSYPSATSSVCGEFPGAYLRARLQVGVLDLEWISSSRELLSLVMESTQEVGSKL